MSWLDLPRVPEPEVMENAGEVEAYSSAAAQAYLNRIDDTFVEHAMRLLGGHVRPAGLALDVGAGPGQIVRKLAGRLAGWRIMGLDRSAQMIRQARGESSGNAAGRVEFLLADGGRMPFTDGCFDLVVCNSVLHHMEQPGRLLEEIARVAKPTGAVLVRDLRRPGRLACPWHVRWHGRRYAGTMYKLYCASVRAAYRRDELSAMLLVAPVAGARVFTFGRTHLGIERQAR